MKKIVIILSALMLLASTAFAGDVINATGSSTIRPIVKKAAKLFKKETGIKVKVKGGGSSVGVKSADDGSADIGMASRSLKSSEPKDLKAHLIGMDGIAMIVNGDNPVKALTKRQIIDIYTGAVTNWKEVGGPDLVITVETKSEGRSTKELFEKYFGLKDKVIFSAHIIGSNTEAIAFVSGTPSAIGYVSVGTAEGASNKGVAVKLLDLEGIKATSRNVANGTYPLRRELNLITKGEANENSQKFIDFILSPEGQTIVAKLEFVPVK